MATLVVSVVLPVRHELGSRSRRRADVEFSLETFGLSTDPVSVGPTRKKSHAHSRCPRRTSREANIRPLVSVEFDQMERRTTINIILVFSLIHCVDEREEECGYTDEIPFDNGRRHL